MFSSLDVGIFIAWDKVQWFQADRPGKASRVETGNIDSMLFYCSITANPGISEATNIRCEDEKIHRIDADNGHLHKSSDGEKS